MFFDVLLNVLAVFGIIALGAFIIVFLSDLLISIVDGSNGIFFRRSSKKKKKGANKANTSDRPKLLPPVSEELEVEEEEEKEVEDNNIDFEQARKEEEELKKLAPKQEDDRARLIRERRKEFERQQVEEEPIVQTVQPIKTVNKIVATKEDEKQEKLDKTFAAVSAEAIKEIEKEDSAKAEVVQAKIVASETKAAEEQENAKLRTQYETEINKLREEVHKSKEQVSKLQEELKTKPEATQVTVVSGSKEEIEEQLVILRQRLKENEKEFSVNKKDYLPLRKVAVTLDNDKKKLRRREAIVAKRKVQLYGVNNYVDIDEAKAKELAEELDLLEGLRLSVGHCEEVMNSNKDRYPILERTHNILKKNVDSLKADIVTLEARLAALEDKDSDNE